MARGNHRRALLIVSLATGLSLFGDTAMYTVLASSLIDGRDGGFSYQLFS